MNQTVETYLRHYINATQNNWVKLLPTAQFAINNMDNETTGVSPFFANHGFHARTPEDALDNPNSQQAMVETTELKELHQRIRDKILVSQQRISTARKQNEGPQLKEGDKVYLDARNLKRKKRTKKLDPK